MEVMEQYGIRVVKSPAAIGEVTAEILAQTS
jgi:hypothetical protein